LTLYRRGAAPSAARDVFNVKYPPKEPKKPRKPVLDGFELTDTSIRGVDSAALIPQGKAAAVIKSRGNYWIVAGVVLPGNPNRPGRATMHPVIPLEEFKGVALTVAERANNPE